jgi:hypothetical protein
MPDWAAAAGAAAAAPAGGGGGCGGGLGGDSVTLHHRRIAADAGALATAQALGGLGILNHQADAHDDGKKCDCYAFHCESPLLETAGG